MPSGVGSTSPVRGRSPVNACMWMTLPLAMTCAVQNPQPLPTTVGREPVDRHSSSTRVLVARRAAGDGRRTSSTIANERVQSEKSKVPARARRRCRRPKGGAEVSALLRKKHDAGDAEADGRQRKRHYSEDDPLAPGAHRGGIGHVGPSLLEPSDARRLFSRDTRLALTVHIPGELCKRRGVSFLCKMQFEPPTTPTPRVERLGARAPTG